MTRLRRKTTSEVLKEFDDEVQHKGIRDLRISAAISSVAFLAFCILDYSVYPEFAGLFLFVRLVVITGNIGILLLTLPAKAYKLSGLLKMAAYLLYSASIIYMTQMTGGYASPYYAGLNIVLIGFMFLLPLDGPKTISVCAIVYLGYIVPIILGPPILDLNALLNNNFFLLTTMMLAIASSYLSSTMHLREFTNRYNLAKANEELKNLDRLKTDFFANVSHEVRTPLTSIIAPLQSLRQGDVGSLNIDQNDLLDQMHRNAVRLLDLINQMLDFSKLEAGKAHLRLAMVDLFEYTEDITYLFTEVASRKGLTIDFEPEGDTGDPVIIDRDRYERILTNLIRNAVKFTRDGGVSIALSRQPGRYVLKITDTGIGISRDQLNHIFERFRQVDGTTTRQYEGTGLGLAIVEESVRLMHGNIAVDSVINMGTVFTVEIPDNLAEREPEAFVERRVNDRRQASGSEFDADRRNNERRKSDYSRIPVSQLALIEGQSFRPHAEVNDEVVPDLDSSHRHVLVTEDNDDLRIYVSRILGRMGHRVTTAANGADAWEKIQDDESIDLLVTDVMMPLMDGYELLKNVRENRTSEYLPVIMITAKAGEDPKLKALNIGADDYLPKPINVRELDARIRNLLTSRDLRRKSIQAEMLDQKIDDLRHSFAQALEIRDAETGNHSREVLAIGSRIAEELNIPVDQTLKDSLLLHDIGKIGIPDNILLKPSSLDDDEYKVMQTHAEVGKQLLESFSNFEEVSDVILAHQEHWDGTGYPQGLKGEEIHPIARIIAVADAFHAMTNTRPYRKAMTQQEAIAELRKNSGTQFDPDVVEAFLRSREILQS